MTIVRSASAVHDARALRRRLPSANLGNIARAAGREPVTEGAQVARMRAIGADGCRAGWVVAAADVDARGNPGAVTISLAPDFAAIARQHADRIVVDMPVGLPESWAPGGRVCDVETRALLGPGRGSSVFPAPPRPSLELASFDDPRREHLGLTLQSWLILPRIREVDDIVTPERQDLRGGPRPVILEGHPELVFADLAGGEPVRGSKRSAEGRLRRRVLLEAAFGRPIPVVVPHGADEDDVLDALACLWVAAAPRTSLSAVPRGFVPRDGRGLAMRIWRRDAADSPPTRRPSDEARLLDRVLVALGPAPGVDVRRRATPGARGLGMTLEHDRARLVVEVDRSAGLDRLTRHWADLRDKKDSRRFFLIHLVRARSEADDAERAREWEFLAARMDEDLMRLGRRRPRGWDAIRLSWGTEADDQVIDAVVGHIRRVLDLDAES
jgi:predicted RNase H-like nuclease